MPCLSVGTKTKNMKEFTKLQTEELLHKIEVRIDTIEDDPNSADEFEATPGALNRLHKKLSSGVFDFTEPEIDFMLLELKDLIDIAERNAKNDGLGANAYINSMYNAVDKLHTAAADM